MGYKPNTQNYYTGNSRITSFKDFDKNKVEELGELKSVRRSFTRNEDETGDIGNKKKFKFNRVTHKMDDESRPEIEDRIDQLDESTSFENAIKTEGRSGIINILDRNTGFSKEDLMGFSVEELEDLWGGMRDSGFLKI